MTAKNAPVQHQDRPRTMPPDLADTVRRVIELELERLDTELARLQAQRAAMHSLLTNEALQTVAGSIAESLTGVTVSTDPNSLHGRIEELFSVKPRMRVSELVSLLVDRHRVPITPTQVERALRSRPDAYAQNARGWWTFLTGTPAPQLAGGVPA